MGHFRLCSQLSDAVNSKDGDGESEQAHFCSRRSKNWSTRSVTALFISSRVASDAGSRLIVAAVRALPAVNSIIFFPEAVEMGTARCTSGVDYGAEVALINRFTTSPGCIGFSPLSLDRNSTRLNSS